MRRETSEIQQHHSSCYGAGTRVEVHRSRYELENVLQKYGADEVLFVEADANASIQFAIHGRCVQLALPLPDPHDPRFTHTPSGKPRAQTAQERAYDQALREHWRSLIVAVRGKLQSVESGISTFEQEFDRFLVPPFAEEQKKRNRKSPRAVHWLLGGSHSLAIALVAAFLVPASAVGAFALPTNVVGHLAAPFRSTVAASASAGQGGSGLALARGGWTPSSGKSGSPSSDAGRLFALRSQLLGDTGGQLRQEASLSAPPTEVADPPAQQSVLASNHPTPLSNDGPPAPPAPAGGGGGGPQQPVHHDPPSSTDAPGPVLPPDNSDGPTSTDTQSSGAGDQTVSSDQPSSDNSGVPDPTGDNPGDTGPAGGTPSTDAPPSPGNGTAPGNGNGNANGQNGTQGQGNGNGQGNAPGTGQGNTPGNGNGNGNGQGNGNVPATGQGNTPGNGNGNGNGNANGQNGTQGQGNGQGTGQGNGKSQGNGAGKGGK